MKDKLCKSVCAVVCQARRRMPRAVNSAAWIPCSSGTFFSDTVGPRGGSGDEGGGCDQVKKKRKDLPC